MADPKPANDGVAEESIIELVPPSDVTVIAHRRKQFLWPSIVN
jgi:hypothetical protein